MTRQKKPRQEMNRKGRNKKTRQDKAARQDMGRQDYSRHKQTRGHHLPTSNTSKPKNDKTVDNTEDKTCHLYISLYNK